MLNSARLVRCGLSRRDGVCRSLIGRRHRIGERCPRSELLERNLGYFAGAARPDHGMEMRGPRLGVALSRCTT